MKMCNVLKCEAVDCAYNVEKTCHTPAITIGDGEQPNCDTFFKSSIRGGVKNETAGVGACKVGSCSHNVDFECGAPTINLDFIDNHIKCVTFIVR